MKVSVDVSRASSFLYCFAVLKADLLSSIQSEYMAFQLDKSISNVFSNLLPKIATVSLMRRPNILYIPVLSELMDDFWNKESNKQCGEFLISSQKIGILGLLFSNTALSAIYLVRKFSHCDSCRKMFRHRLIGYSDDSTVLFGWIRIVICSVISPTCSFPGTTYTHDIVHGSSV